MQQIKLFPMLFICIVFFTMFSVSVAQVIEGDVTLSTQAEVNSFTGTSVTGYLKISGSDIVDLSPLSTLTSVGGYLGIRSNSSLTSLDGLSALTSVGGDMFVYYNDVLTNLDGLSALSSVGGDLVV